VQWLDAAMARESSEDDSPIKINNTKCETLGRGFLGGPAKALLKGYALQADAGLRDLATIIKQAIRVGFVMWRQPLDIEIRGYQDLRGRRFAIDDKEVKTHASQLDPSRLPNENAVIDMVIQPSFVVRQNEHAEKVWGQAVVLWH
jgi:hypothetical protein